MDQQQSPSPCVRKVWRRSWKRKPVISQTVINFRHDFTQLTIGRVKSHFWVVFFDRRRYFRRLNGNK